jgi:hypothetical protein
MNTYPYKGWGFEELGRALGVCTDAWDYFGEHDPRHFDDDIWLKEFLYRVAFSSDGSRVQKKVAAELRAYMKVLAEIDQSYWQEIWKGMVLCEDDYTLLVAASKLVGYMWS